MPGAPTMAHWRTAYPNGEGIYVQALRNADQRALARAERAEVLALPAKATTPETAKAA